MYVIVVRGVSIKWKKWIWPTHNDEIGVSQWKSSPCHTNLPCFTSYFLRLSNLSWSAFFNKPSGSQKPKGGWTPTSLLKSIFKAEVVGLALLGAKANAPISDASNRRYLNICIWVYYTWRYGRIVDVLQFRHVLDVSSNSLLHTGQRWSASRLFI